MYYYDYIIHIENEYMAYRFFNTIFMLFGPDISKEMVVQYYLCVAEPHSGCLKTTDLMNSCPRKSTRIALLKANNCGCEYQEVDHFQPLPDSAN